MRIVVTLGPTEIDFGAKVNSNGYIEWNRAKEVRAVQCKREGATINTVNSGYNINTVTRKCFGLGEFTVSRRLSFEQSIL